MPALLPRRHFLRQTLAATGATAIFGRSLFAADQPRAHFGLGFTLYGMKSLSLDEALQACAEIGYDNVELCLLEGYPADPKSLAPADRTHLRETLAARRMRVSGLMENYALLADDAKQALQLERIKAAGQLAHELSPDAPAPVETVLGGKPGEWDQVKDKMVTNLRTWTAAAEAARVVIAIKAHIMHAVQTPEQLLWLLDAVHSPALQAAYDYSHFQLQNLDLDATLAALLPRTRFVHVKDGRLTADGKVEFMLPGEGTTDYGALFAKLQAGGYRGDVVVEVSAMIFKKDGYDPKVAATKSYAALHAGLAKAGLALKE